jgi:hypothetical protein
MGSRQDSPARPRGLDQGCGRAAGSCNGRRQPQHRASGGEEGLAEIWGAEDKSHTLAAVKAFASLFGAKFPKAVAKITGDLEQLLAFYDYPAEHWVHLRYQPDRVDFRDRAAPHQDHPRTRLPSRGAWRWLSNSSRPRKTAGGR